MHECNIQLMKKRFLLLIGALLSFSLMMINCSKRTGDVNLNANDNVVIENIVNIGDNEFPINIVFGVVKDNDIDINISTEDMSVVITLDNHDIIPTGSFELKTDGRYTAGAAMIGTELRYDLTGSLTIVSSDTVYSLKASGNASVGRAVVPFTIDYKGEIVKP